MHREFTGRHMAVILAGGFAIVIAVNFYMASLAIRGFGGVVVENSYVASQEFNGWLEAAKQSDALGYEASVERGANGHLLVRTKGVPAPAHISAQIRRPLGKPETQDITFNALQNGKTVSTVPVSSGRWIVRVTVTTGDKRWVGESQIS